MNLPRKSNQNPKEPISKAIGNTWEPRTMKDGSYKPHTTNSVKRQMATIKDTTKCQEMEPTTTTSRTQPPNMPDLTRMDIKDMPDLKQAHKEDHPEEAEATRAKTLIPTTFQKPREGAMARDENGENAIDADKLYYEVIKRLTFELNQEPRR